MANTQNTSIAKESNVRLIGEGLGLGAATSLVVSTLYIIVGLIVMEFLGQGFGSSPGLIEYGFWGDVFVTTLAIIMVFMFTLPPAMILGAMTGLYFGVLAKLVGKRMQMSRYLFLVVSVASCLVGVIFFHILFRGPIANALEHTGDMFSIGVYGTYPFIVGFPSLIYVLMGSWVGWKLYSNVDIQTDEQK